MGKWIGASVIIVTLFIGGLLWWQGAPTRLAPPDTAQEQAEIQTLKQGSDQARAEVARLKKVAAEAEQRARLWEQRAGAAQARAIELSAQVARLARERQEQKRVSTVEEAWHELRRLGF